MNFQRKHLRGLKYLDFPQEDIKMKKIILGFGVCVLSLAVAASVWANPLCPQPRKTKAAPANLAAMDKTATAHLENGKKVYTRTAKPMACKMCHGDNGDGAGKLGKALKPNPRNFTCSETMKNVSAGQMFWIIKNGSPGTGMVAHGKTLKDEQIWDVIKYIRSSWVK